MSAAVEKAAKAIDAARQALLARREELLAEVREIDAALGGSTRRRIEGATTIRWAAVRECLRQHPGSTAREISDALGHNDYLSRTRISALMCRYRILGVLRGEVVAGDARNIRRYWVNETNGEASHASS